jgi:hypothetical protein
VVSFIPGRFISRVKAPDTSWIEGWVGPKASLDAVAKRENPITAPIESRTHSLVLIPTELPRIPIILVTLQNETRNTFTLLTYSFIDDDNGGGDVTMIRIVMNNNNIVL